MRRDKINAGSPKLREDARKLIEALDAFEQSEQAAHVQWVRNTTPANRVARAFQEMPVGNEVKLLKVLVDNPGSTSAALSDKLGWGGQAWHMHFGTMCQAREAWLWPAEKSEMRDRHFYSGNPCRFRPGWLTLHHEEGCRGGLACHWFRRADPGPWRTERDGGRGMDLHKEIHFEDEICATLPRMAGTMTRRMQRRSTRSGRCSPQMSGLGTGLAAQGVGGAGEARGGCVAGPSAKADRPARDVGGAAPWYRGDGPAFAAEASRIQACACPRTPRLWSATAPTACA